MSKNGYEFFIVRFFFYQIMKRHIYFVGLWAIIDCKKFLTRFYCHESGLLRLFIGLLSSKNYYSVDVVDENAFIHQIGLKLGKFISGMQNNFISKWGNFLLKINSFEI